MDKAALLYSPTHEWVKIEGEFAIVGITDFAIRGMSDLVFLQLPAVGRYVEPQEAVGEIESLKTVSDIYCPLRGQIVEVKVSLTPQTLADDPFGEGWLFRLHIRNNIDPRLLTFEEYLRHCATALL